MARRHSSFLVRCWDLDSDTQRIEIEHIQSGTKVLATSVAAAAEWICARSTDTTRESRAPDRGDVAVVGDEPPEPQRR